MDAGQRIITGGSLVIAETAVDDRKAHYVLEVDQDHKLLGGDPIVKLACGRRYVESILTPADEEAVVCTDCKNVYENLRGDE